MAPAKAAARRAWNRAVASVRCRVEKSSAPPSAATVSSARYVGLARVSLQVHLTFIAYNLTRATRLLAARATT